MKIDAVCDTVMV